MMKLRAKNFLRSNSKATKNNNGANKSSSKGKEIKENGSTNEIEWEVRPGGMLVQKRSDNGSSNAEEDKITIKVFNVSQWHDISIEATSTFGDLKKLNYMVTGLHPREQRLLYRGKEREDDEHLHMVGVGDKEKVLLLEDPSTKERKLKSLLVGGAQAFYTNRRTIIV